jgi:O-antigen/teichoic acid export membrane protein
MNVTARIRGALIQSHFARNVTILTGATLVGQVIAVAAVPFLTRLFNPAAFGVAAVFSSVTSILYPITSLRYELAIPLPADEQVGANLFGLSLALLLPTTALMAGVTWIWGPALLSTTGAQSVTRFLPLVPLGLFVAGAFQAGTLWAVRVRDFRSVGRSRIVQGIGLASIPLGGGLLNAPNPLWLVLGQVGGQMAGYLTIARTAWHRDRETLRAITWRGMSAAARQYRRFPQLSLGSGLLGSTTLYAPSLLLAATYGIGAAGGFALSTRFVGIPMGLLGQSVSSVYLGEAPHAASRRDTELGRLYRRTAWGLLVFGGIPLLAAGLVAPWLSVWIFGPGWSQAGHFIRLLAPSYVAALVMSPLSQTLIVIGRLDLELFWAIARLFLVIASVIVPYKLGASPEQAVGVYSLSLLVSYAALFSLTTWAMRKRLTRDDDYARQPHSLNAVG